MKRKDVREGKQIPGPKGLPIVGNITEVNTENMHVKCFEYAGKFGDIFQVKLLNQRLIILNSESLTRLAGSADRYKQYMNDKPGSFYGDMFFYGSQCTVLCQHGFSAEHNGYRKGFTKATKDINIGCVSLIAKIESTENLDFEIVSEIKLSLADTLSSLLIGKQFKGDDPNRKLIGEFSDITDFFLQPSVNDALQMFPFLRHLPGSYGKQFKRATKAIEAIIDVYFHQQKESYDPVKVRGTVDHTLKDQLKEIEMGKEPFFTDERIISQILEIMSTGMLTTWAFLSNALLCLLNHPECQERMFLELDKVIGRARELDVKDVSDCPYVEAVELEVHRYVPVVNFLDAKHCNADLVFEGYGIPKGSMVLANVWYIHHNEKIWGDPWTFRPERWLDEQGNLVPKDHTFRKNWFPFGYGRRQCVGEQFARSTSFLYLASIFRRWKLVSSPGQSVSCDPRDKHNYDSIVTIRPKPFFARFEERY